MKNEIKFFIFILCLPIALKSQPSCLPETCCCGASHEVGIINGNFEAPPYAPNNSYQTFFAGSNYSNWSVISGSIDLLGPNTPTYNNGNPNGLSQYLDLNGYEPGTITTTISGLKPGSEYAISLWYAKNQFGPYATCTVQVNNGAWMNESWTVTNNGTEFWLNRCLKFVAEDVSAELKFIGGGPSPPHGVLLDNITMWECPNDLEPPVLAITVSDSIAVSCNEGVQMIPIPVFQDNCSAQILVSSQSDTLFNPCMQKIHRLWIATDECGNSSTFSQIIAFIDNEEPTISLPAQNLFITCSPYDNIINTWLLKNGMAEGSDHCNEITWDHDFDGFQGNSSVLVTFQATDNCGNESQTSATVTINLQNDTTVLDLKTCDPGKVGTYVHTYQTSSGCDSIVIENIKYYDCKCKPTEGQERKIYLPNVFKPYGNSLNSIFYIHAGKECLSLVKNFQIFDRWGNMVYEFKNFLPNDPIYGWDGNLNHKPMPSGIYVWIAEIQFDDNSLETLSGEVLLVR